MKIILLKDVQKVGKKYDVKNVSDGFALNFLIPQGNAKLATANAIKSVEQLKNTEAVDRKVREDLLMKNLADLSKAEVTITGKASEKGHLFSGIHKEQLVEEIKKQTRLDVGAEFIELDKPLKEIGEHMITVKVGDKKAEFKLHLLSS